MMPQGEEPLDISVEELAAYQETQRAFAANFFRRQIVRYETQLGLDAAVRFTRWWKNYAHTIALFAETQQEFDGEAFSSCDDWLSRWVQRQAKLIIAGEKETAPSPEDEVARIRASWGVTKGALRIPPSIPPRAWKPCKHWGVRWEFIECPWAPEVGQWMPEENQRLCENCAAERESMVGQYSEQTQEMYDKHRPFVRKRLHEELLPYTKQTGQHPQFDDIEQRVWAKVMTSLGSYESQGTPLAWLRTIVNSVVLDYFKAAYLARRDVRQTQTLGDHPSKALDQIRQVDDLGNPCLPQVKPVSPGAVTQIRKTRPDNTCSLFKINLPQNWIPPKTSVN